MRSEPDRATPILLVASLDNRDEPGNRICAAVTDLQQEKLSSYQAGKRASDQAAAIKLPCLHAVVPSCRHAAMPQ